MKPVIGLEVHVELKTKSKMFCGCSADYFGKKPNTHTCPVCLGLPGALPIPNKEAIEWCVILGMALNCNIPQFSKFDRKNYFYPDLPKGYQISQYDEPFCINGTIKLDNGKIITVRRVHMEEDTGKLIHKTAEDEDVTLIDFNRSGVPLVEIVTEPDFDNTKDVLDYLKKLQQIARYLNISNADMEKGDMRLEPNISISTDGKLPTYKVEVKNINSFRFVGKSIDYEIKRQTDFLKEGKKPTQETRGWDETKQKTVTQRVKEETSDYRYFPEPDIPPIRWAKEKLMQIKKQIPELPDTKKRRFQKQYNISQYDAEILTREKALADFYETCVSDGQKANLTAKQVSNYIINKKIDIESALPAEIIKSIKALTIYLHIDESEIEKIVEKVLKENKNAVGDYRNGKTSAVQYLIGKVLMATQEKLEVSRVKKILEEKLKLQK